jgi:hypothetical protein
MRGFFLRVTLSSRFVPSFDEDVARELWRINAEPTESLTDRRMAATFGERSTQDPKRALAFRATRSATVDATTLDRCPASRVHGEKRAATAADGRGAACDRVGAGSGVSDRAEAESCG